MHSPLRSAALRLLFLLLPAMAFSQPYIPYPTWWLGLTGGYTHAWHTRFERGTVSPLEGELETSQGPGFSAGVMIDHSEILPPIFRRLWRPTLRVDLIYEHAPGAFDLGTDNYVAVNASGEPAVATALHRMDLAYDMLKLGLTMRQAPFTAKVLGGIWSIDIGPTFSYLLRAEGVHRHTIIDADPTIRFPESATYQTVDGGREAVMNDRSITGVNRFRLGARGGISYEVAFGSYRDVLFIPGISFDYALTPGAAGSTWRAHQLQITADLGFNVRSWFRSLFPGPEEMDSPLSVSH